MVPPLYWAVGWIQRNQTWVLFKGTNSLLERQSSPLLYACGPKCLCYIRPENEELNIAGFVREAFVEDVCLKGGEDLS